MYRGVMKLIKKNNSCLFKLSKRFDLFYNLKKQKKTIFLN